MVLTLATTHRPATDLGYLLHKNPARAHRAELGFGDATLLFPQADEARCEAALFVEVDPVRLVRSKNGPASAGREIAECAAARGLEGAEDLASRGTA